MNFPITFAHVEVILRKGVDDFKTLEFDNCQMIITGDYLIINKEPVRPTEKTKVVESEVFHMKDVQKYITTTHLPEEYKGLITE